MIKELIEYILSVAYQHKAVQTVGYVNENFINSQSTDKYYKFLIEDEAILNKNIYEGVDVIKLNIDILGFVNKDNSILKCQDDSLHILFDVLAYINNDNKYQLEVHDYSILSFSEYSKDLATRLRVNLSLIVPNILDKCTYKDNFEEKEVIPEEELNISTSDDCTNTTFTHKNMDKEITLKNIKL